MSRHFERGETVTLRDVHAGRIKAAVQFITVEHSPNRFVGWLAAGAQFALPVDESGVPVKAVMRNHRLAELTWAMPNSPGQLIIVPTDAMYSVILRFFGDAWDMPEWYINLQSALYQTEIGFDSTDYVLDLVVAADGSAWRWKDTDEFRTAVRDGFVSRERARTIRAVGDHALALAREGAPPFDSEFRRFRPDPVWTAPALSANWRDVPVLPSFPTR